MAKYFIDRVRFIVEADNMEEAGKKLASALKKADTIQRNEGFYWYFHEDDLRRIDGKKYEKGCPIDGE